MWDLIVIGGGAAGLWAAGTAAARGGRVVVLEKNRKPGVKILMSGGTRCNITHHCDVAGVLAAFGKQGRWLKHAMHELPPSAIVAEFQRWGVATKVEETGKVFPVSDSAVDVRDALVRRLTTAGAQLLSGVAVTDLRLEAPGLWNVQTATESLTARQVLLCCGGLSYPGCGTTGDGYAWATRLGHTLTATFPALTPLVSPAQWVHQLTGITLPDVQAKIIDPHGSKDSRQQYRGSFLWTHFGCSGPVPMNVSRFVAAAQVPSQVTLQLDLVPDLDESRLNSLLDASQQGRKTVSSVLQSLMPRNMAACLMQRSSLADGVSLAELPRVARLKILADLKRLVVPLSGTRGYAKAEVTAGGISTQEVNPRTMESRLVPGLFLAGEILDIDGPIGGFNFQAAFSTGHMAGLHVNLDHKQDL